MYMNRRNFLKSCLAAGAVSLLPGVSLAAQPGALRTQTRLMMGTTVTISAAHPSATLADEAIGRAFERMFALEKVFDRHNRSGAVAVLNGQGTLKDAPTSLVALLGDALTLHRASAGAFDVSVAPLVDLMQKGGGLDRKDYAEARVLADISAVEVSGRSIRLKKRGMALTFDGIAKGGITDAGAAVMRESGIKDFLINSGGDIYAAGQKAPGKDWSIAVESPEKNGKYPAVIQLSNRGMATSGVYERPGHLINPVSGTRAELYKSITVTAPTVKEADALATTLAAMPLERAVPFVAARPGCSALFIDHNGRLHSSNWA